MTPAIVVWFKRDLRVVDHEPLDRAVREGKVLPLYIVEPEYWSKDYTSGRQWSFLKDSLISLDRELTALGQPLWTVIGDVEKVLDHLYKEFRFCRIVSHQETGPGWTYERDLKVKRWSEDHGVVWDEYRQHGVVRGLQERRGWASQWGELMGLPQFSVPKKILGVGSPPIVASDVLQRFSCSNEISMSSQEGGRSNALSLLDSFLDRRCETYRSGMSSPSTGEIVCSRISTHLSVGTLSLREVWQRTLDRRQILKKQTANSVALRSLKSFQSRLHWHCHFIQKLESEPRLEFEELHRGFIGLRQGEPDLEIERLDRFCRGALGWPFVDACLRCLAATGWLNFRMRAMLVSIASYHLWVDWQKTGIQMARWFTDFEAGIHWSQIQMQSGNTGINANRIYSPIKQSEDQDPQGIFIKRWVPELESVPIEWIHQPWRMPPRLQQKIGCRIGLDYPEPIGDPTQLAREARSRLKSWIESHDMKPEAKRVLKAHGSRLRQVRPRYGKKASLSQMALDLE
ncbi:MAG: deoxyribodipyrimidine photolyase [Gammaproteobacteria bacterium]|nr:deoxyribodipyrimidine photolyase [Gammaproteobacteria bacterium]